MLDYANQLVGVLSEFERGNHETFAVSPDYYSNNLSFKFDPQAKKLEVCEVNGGDFRVSFPYKPFKEAVRRFYRDLLDDYRLLYPELEDNHAFQQLRIKR